MCLGDTNKKWQARQGYKSLEDKNEDFVGRGGSLGIVQYKRTKSEYHTKMWFYPKVLVNIANKQTEALSQALKECPKY